MRTPFAGMKGLVCDRCETGLAVTKHIVVQHVFVNNAVIVKFYLQQ